MNHNEIRPALNLPPQTALDALQARFALRVTAGLTQRSADIGPDVTERLRFAREKALECARAVRTVEAANLVSLSRGGAAVLKQDVEEQDVDEDGAEEGEGERDEASDEKQEECDEHEDSDEGHVIVGDEDGGKSGGV